MAAATGMAEVLDTAREHETPEGIVLRFALAGPVARACAWAIDALIRAGLYLLMALGFSALGGIGTAATLIGLFLIEWFYPTVFEARSGATPGKRAMGLQVVHDDGTPLSWASSVIRNLLRTADFFPLLYGTGLVCMLANRDFKRLGDIAAGTLVIYRSAPYPRLEFPDIVPTPPPLALAAAEQQVLLDFAERRERLSRDRLQELARLFPHLSDRAGEDAVTEVLGYAAWLARGR